MNLSRLWETRRGLYIFYWLAQTGLFALIGGSLMLCCWFAFAIRLGIVAYAITVTFHTLLSLWRIRRRMD